MNLFLHLVRWDARRFRVLLAVWLALVAVRTVLDGVWPTLAVDVESRTTAGIVGMLLALAEVLLSMVFVAVIVQEHALVGTTAFWLTRPIPAPTLLAAKLALAGAALIAVPVIAHVALMVAFAIPPLQIAGVAAQTALWWALWLGIVMTLAALTPNVAKFALAVGGVLIALAIFFAATITIMINRQDDSPPLAGTTGVYDPTSDMVGTVLMILAIVILLFVQYRSRSRTRAVAIGVACVAITVVVTDAWPWPVLAPRIDTPTWSADPSMLRLSANADTVNIDRTVLDWGDRPSVWRLTRARVWLSGIAAGWSADISVRESSIRTGSGASLTSHVSGQRAGIAIENVEGVPNREAIRRLLEVERIDDGSPATQAGSVVVHYARYPDLQRIAPATGIYDGRFEVLLTRHVVEAVLPLRVGAAHVSESHQFSVARIQPREGRMSIVAHESSARSVFERRPLSRTTLYLRNRPLSEAMEGSQYDVRNDVALATVIPFVIGLDGSESSGSGFRPRTLMIEFPPMYGEKASIALDERWLAQAELVIVRSTEGGAVERRLAIADFPIRAE